MALRVMQIYLPDSPKEEVDEFLEGREVLGRWRDETTKRFVLHLLVPAEETEPIMDRLEQRYASADGFHVILFPVEAALPRPEVENDDLIENGDEEEADEGQRHRISREELYNNINDGMELSRVFVGMTVLSAVVAAVGLLRNDVAVIIGAMVIAPLLGPNVAISLATTLGDFALLRRAFIINVVGISIAFVVALIMGLFLDVNPEIPAIHVRTDVKVGDILLAIAAGAAGTLAVTRGISGAVIGVMVAVALMPPLVVFGMLIGKGFFSEAMEAGLLTLVNVICVNLSGVATFVLQGVRPRSYLETERAKKATVRAVAVWLALLITLTLVLLWN